MSTPSRFLLNQVHREIQHLEAVLKDNDINRSAFPHLNGDDWDEVRSKMVESMTKLRDVLKMLERME